MPNKRAANKTFIGFTIDKQDAKIISDYAAKHGITISDVIRMALESAVMQKSKKTTTTEKNK